MEYEKIIKIFKDAPRSFLAGLIIELIAIAHKKGIFKNNNPEPFLKLACEKLKVDCMDCIHANKTFNKILFRCDKQQPVKTFGNKHFCKDFKDAS